MPNSFNNLEKIEYLNRVAEEMNVETYLPEVIEYLNKLTFENYHQYLTKNILEKRPELTTKKLFKIWKENLDE